ncbi:BglG family transcription antiterminator [Streptococcus gordonii]|uniref:BglG family transcription antiterminator n=1 Tax=Streptococcus gordonii TaxID=1302 RepID=UPI001CBCF761|nr:PTS sugar transporter subunit IIA [Streptococcus gordonii]MBZ2133352.1 PRD domain-containing protein [Streptococcus gordonii]MBZ2141889.1 PRD domain-containing protein [Streptococcus gordonii]MBZ2143021.1 PRD domain-containing protein [Streptococcus gordonii]MBZ2145532.1 PRD domain-containing protein [Streptococcus gordonii]
MQKKRQNNIIDILNDKEEWLTGKALAQMLNVSDRTIRSDIQAINREYQREMILSNKRLGYKLDEKAISDMELVTNNIIPQTPQERCIWIIKELLFDSKELNLYDLENRVFISGYSIENDLGRIKKMIKDYHLNLKRSKNFVKLIGEENEKRKLYRKLLTDEVQGNFTNLNILATLFSDFDFLKISDVFTETCYEYDYQIKESLFPIVMIHAGVAIERIISGNYAENIELPDEYFTETLEYQLSKEFFERVEEECRIHSVKNEIIKFAILLCSSNSQQDFTQKEEIREIVTAVLSKINDNFDIDFSDDEALVSGLGNHISSLIEQQKTNTSMSNVYLKEIKRKYPLVFEMAVHVGEVLSERLEKKVGENELSFIALHLGAAYDRVNNPSKYRAVVVIPNNQMLSKVFIDRINLRFEERMTIISHYNMFDERQIVVDSPNLIISTVPLKHYLEIPTLQLSLLFNYEDESKVFQLLNQLDKVRYRERFQKMMEHLTKRKLFYRKERVRDAKEAIVYLCDKLIKKGLADENYKSDVMKREQISSTSFVQGFAVIHSIEITTSESCIATLTLSNPVQWGNFEVRLVILLAIREEDNRLLSIFFDWLSNLVMDSQKLSALLSAKDQNEFIRSILE